MSQHHKTNRLWGVAIEIYDTYMYVEGICNTHTEYQTYDLKLALKNLQVTPLKSRQMPSFESTAFELKALYYALMLPKMPLI